MAVTNAKQTATDIVLHRYVEVGTTQRRIMTWKEIMDASHLNNKETYYR